MISPRICSCHVVSGQSLYWTEKGWDGRRNKEISSNHKSYKTRNCGPVEHFYLNVLPKQCNLMNTVSSSEFSIPPGMLRLPSPLPPSAALIIPIPYVTDTHSSTLSLWHPPETIKIPLRQGAAHSCKKSTHLITAECENPKHNVTISIVTYFWAEAFY
jgi:hypothetical protein